MKIKFNRDKSWSSYVVDIVVAEPRGAHYRIFADIDWYKPGHLMAVTIYSWVPVGSKIYRYVVEDLE